MSKKNKLCLDNHQENSMEFENNHWCDVLTLAFDRVAEHSLPIVFVQINKIRSFVCFFLNQNYSQLVR